MISFVILLIGQLCIILSKVEAQRHMNIAMWEKEGNKSLSRNIRMQCKTTIVPGLSMPPSYSDTLYVSTSYPSRAEVQSFQRLPPTLTKSNAAITANAISKGYGYDKWASDKAERWEVPSDHVGQNRSNCYDLTALAGEGHLLDVYNPFKSVHKAFYILRNKNAVIHPSGSVAFKCGYYMGYESCENKWDQANAWWSKCMKTFTKHSLIWQDIWPDTASSPDKHRNAMIQIRNCSIRWDILDQPQLNGSYIYAPKHYKRVFVISAVWDYNYHHFIADSLARMSRHLRFLQANPDVYIHLRLVEEYEIRDEAFKKAAEGMRLRLLALLGIAPSRLVWGIVLAEEVYIPRHTYCAYTLANPTEIRLLARELLNGARKEVHRRSGSSILPVHPSSTVAASASGQQQQQRRALATAREGAPFTVDATRRGEGGGEAKERDELYIDPKGGGVKRRAKKKYLVVQQRHIDWFRSTDREWNNATFDKIANAFAQQYPNHTLIKVSSLDPRSPDYCLGCEILHFSNADIFVAAHGAGMTNIMFMPPGSMVVEIFGDLKDVNMPYCGYYGPLSAIVGAHHFLFSFNYHKNPSDELDDARVQDIVKQSHEFYLNIKKPRSELKILTINSNS